MPIIYQVYVVELSKSIFTESKKFRMANPQFNGILECLYVGMTSKSPEERLEQHIQSIKSKRGHDLSARFVKKYGLYLRPSLYNHLPKMIRPQALAAEQKLALDLKRQRYAVWVN